MSQNVTLCELFLLDTAGKLAPGPRDCDAVEPRTRESGDRGQLTVGTHGGGRGARQSPALASGRPQRGVIWHGAMLLSENGVSFSSNRE